VSAIAHARGAAIRVAEPHAIASRTTSQLIAVKPSNMPSLFKERLDGM
jgi:hypothetical protein